MIRFSDAATLAYTKLKVHRIRTGVAVAVAALLFGLIGAVIIIAQGVFTSVESFNEEGLNGRTILLVNRSGSPSNFNEYDLRSDAAFIKEVEEAHAAIVAKKKAAAKKYDITYDATLQDPTPIVIDPVTKQKTVSETRLSSEAVQNVVSAKRAAEYVPFNINDFTKKYSSARPVQIANPIQPTSGALTYMNKGEELFFSNDRERMEQYYNNETPQLSLLNESLSSSFVTSKTFDPSKGEVPVIIPFAAAQKALGLKPLDAKASTKEKLERLNFVRSNVDKATVSFCYRNEASAALLAKAQGQADEIKVHATDKEYVKPKLLYAMPAKADCGPVVIASDTRSAAEKKQDVNLELYEKEIGVWFGEPVQKKVTVRGVGISNDLPTGEVSSLASFVQSLFGSSLGGEWSIPTDLLAKLPVDSRPGYLFESDMTEANKSGKTMVVTYESYLVEFTDKNQAREALAANVPGGFGKVFTIPFGSSALFVDEARSMFVEILKWALLMIGGIAVIILASILGRTVAEGRRESAIFRAIGASRGDIISVYGMYVLFLALRVVLFMAVLAVVMAIVVQVLFGADATLGARLAYAATDTSREFLLFDFRSIYLLWIIGVIFAASIVASIVPILLGARRNPIKDMREE